MRTTLARLLVVAGLLTGCDLFNSGTDTADAGRTPDGGPGDARPPGDGTTGPEQDAATRDAQPTDAQPTDARPSDAQPSDAQPTDAQRSDGATDAAGLDATPLPAPDDRPPRALFDPDAPGAEAVDAPLATLVNAWHAHPDGAASAQAQAEALRRSIAALRETGPAAADRVVDACEGIPVQQIQLTLVCLRLLSYVDSPRSLGWLTLVARTAVPPWPEGAHPIDPAPQALARQVAIWSLGQRAREGTPEALDRLLRLVGDPETPDRADAVRAVYEALPRVRAKARLRAVLPPGEAWRLYETR